MNDLCQIMGLWLLASVVAAIGWSIFMSGSEEDIAPDQDKYWRGK
jgi:hypothetical protein